MRRRARIAAAVMALATLATGSLAGEIEKGATFEVRADSIWFQDAAMLTQWQQLKKAGNSAALASYENDVLSTREAWQFTKQLTVEILGYDPDERQVNVELKTPGRLLGTQWLLDADALVP